jgi:hypothetical protein
VPRHVPHARAIEPDAAAHERAALGSLGDSAHTVRVDAARTAVPNGGMSSLTTMLKDTNSPVSQWMREQFPNPRPLLAAIRQSAGTTVLHPPEGIAYTTQGGAIDWWLRFIAVPGSHPDLGVASKGLEALEGYPAAEAAWPMFTTPTNLSISDQMEITVEVSSEEPVDMMLRLLGFDAEWQARTCFALSLLTECFRAGVRPGSRLLTVPEGAGPQALLDLATADEVADLIAMRDSALRVFFPDLPVGKVHTGPTFDGSRYLPADADLIVGDTLIEIKSTIGGPPRKDGTRAVKFDRSDLYQLLGYLLMDTSGQYWIGRVGLYAIRFESFQIWPVDQFLEAAAGRPLDLAEARGAFAHVLHDRMPPYLSTLYGIDWSAYRGLDEAEPGE